MTCTTNARVAGFAFLAYIAAGVTDMMLSGHATRGASVAERLATIDGNLIQVRVLILLGFVQVFCAVLLGVTLFAITRNVDTDLARMGMIFRFGEGLFGAFGIRRTLDLLWLATARSDVSSIEGLGAYLFQTSTGGMAAIFFAIGSTFFAYLLLRGRLIPVALAWIGVIASAILVLCLPLQLVGLLSGPLTAWIWLPMLAFEVPLGLWLIVKPQAIEAARVAAAS